MNKLYFIFAFVFVLVLSSCEQVTEFKIDQISESKFLIYAFPSDKDTYFINVCATKSVYNEMKEMKNVKVTCLTNGTPDEVKLVHTETHNGIPLAIYEAKGHHSSGDKISITVEGEGLPTASGSTIIPKKTEMQILSKEKINNDNQDYLVYKVGFQDSADEDYYAVRAYNYYDTKAEADNGTPYNPSTIPSDEDEEKDIYSNDGYTSSGEPYYSFHEILTEREPLLSHYVDLNLDAWNEYYKNLYFFNDEKMTSSDVTMHLYVKTWREEDCILQFFTLSRDFHQMLLRLNDQLSNDLGTAGLSQMYSTFNNIKGGYGCIAGYTLFKPTISLSNNL